LDGGNQGHANGSIEKRIHVTDPKKML